ncbi:MAG: hypothetical protein AAF696_22540 [Bacteroidota bacterium]
MGTCIMFMGEDLEVNANLKGNKVSCLQSDVQKAGKLCSYAGKIMEKKEAKDLNRLCFTCIVLNVCKLLGATRFSIKRIHLSGA